MDVSVIVATYGDDPIWQQRAQTALASARAQTHPPREVIHQHGPTLHEARNTGAARAAGEWLCFLDADDTLHLGYLEAMAAREHDADLLGPAVQYVFEGGKPIGGPTLIAPMPLTDGNYLVVGTLVRKAMFTAVGGFEGWAFYEDWALWLRCHLAGATVAQVADAVYIATHRFGSRNKAPKRDEKEAMHFQIRDAILGATA